MKMQVEVVRTPSLKKSQEDVTTIVMVGQPAVIEKVFNRIKEVVKEEDKKKWFRKVRLI